MISNTSRTPPEENVTEPQLFLPSDSLLLPVCVVRPVLKEFKFLYRRPRLLPQVRVCSTISILIHASVISGSQLKRPQYLDDCVRKAGLISISNKKGFA